MARDAGSRERDHELNLLLRALPSVDELLQRLGDVPHALAVDAARRAIEARRVALAGSLTAAGWSP